MRKWNEIKNEPITWCGYAKLCVWCSLIACIVGAIEIAIIWGYYYADEISEKIKGLIERVKKKFEFRGVW